MDIMVTHDEELGDIRPGALRVGLKSLFAPLSTGAAACSCESRDLMQIASIISLRLISSGVNGFRLWPVLDCLS